MIKVTYTTRFSIMERTFPSYNEAARYAVGIKREMNRVRVPLLSLTIDGVPWVK